MTDEFWITSKSLLKFQSYSDIVENLYQKAIIESFQHLQIVPNANSLLENIIRNYLVFDLENHNITLRPYLQSKILKLTKENTILLSPVITKRTDIEFFVSGYGDYVIECKNLKTAEQRYIDEGINRFTTEFYSKEDSESGMIAFIVGGNISSIVKNILAKIVTENSFVQKCSTHNLCYNYPQSFHTIHKRVTKTDIYIHHLFLDLTKSTGNNS